MRDGRLTVVAITLSRMGFNAREFRIVPDETGEITNFVKVRLYSRKPSKMEVEAALEQSFPGIEFDLKSTSDSVEVRLQNEIR